MKILTKMTKPVLLLTLFICGFLSTTHAGWVNVGTQNFTPAMAGSPIIVLDKTSGTPYVAFSDGNNGDRLSVMTFDGSSWNTLGSAGISVGGSFQHTFAIDKTGVLYVAYIDIGFTNAISVKKFDGNDWVSLDGQNTCTGSGCYNLSFTTDTSGTPYLAYNSYNSLFSANTLNVQKFNGSNWVPVGSPDISTSDADFPCIKFSPNNIPYVGYRDKSAAYKGTVRMFDGSDWVAVGSIGFTPEQADWTSIAIDNSGAVYFSYSDYSQYGTASVMKYDGTSWNFVGAQGFSAGSTAFNKISFDNNNTPYVVYSDGDVGYGTSAMKFNGNAWVSFGCPDIIGSQASNPTLAFDATNTAYIAIRDDDNNNRARVVKLETNNVVIQNQPSDLSSCGWMWLAEFSVDASNVSSYQWQEDDGNGFVNIQNSWPFYGANEEVLQVYYPTNYNKSGYKYRCLITGDDCGQTDTSTFATFTARAMFTQNPEDVTLCGNDSLVEYYVENADSVLSYQWKLYDEDQDEYLNISDNAVYSGTNSNTFSISNVNASMNESYFACEVTTATGCVVNTYAGLYVDENPQITARSSSSTICLGNEVRLWGEDGYNFQWDHGVEDDELFTPDSTAIYTVTGYDWYGCPATTTIEVLAAANTLPVPAIVSSGPVSFCPGDSVTLTATNTSGSFQWSSGDSTSAITVNAIGEYTVMNYDSYGCTKTSAAINIYTPILPEIHLSQTLDCNGSAVEISAIRNYDIPKDMNSISSCDDGFYIDGFSFAGINNQNSGCSQNSNMNYAFYPSMMAAVNPGNKYAFTFTPPSTISSDVTHAIWLDLNQDGDFSDEQEMVYTSYNSSEDWSMNTFTDSLEIPSTAYAGITRMRIRTSAQSSFYPYKDGSNRFDQGETEDYMIQIGNAAPFIYSWTSIPAGFTSNVAAPGISPSLDTTYVLEVTDTVWSCTKITSFTLDSTMIITPGSYGKNQWNVFAYDGPDTDVFEGYYVETSADFYSGNRWGWDYSPSDYSGYKGCEVTRDNHFISYRRQGFEPGYYSLDIPGHDDNVYVYINDSLVFEHDGCCDSHQNIWTGLLDETTKVKYEWLEGGGGSYGDLELNLLYTKPVLDDITAKTSLCESPTAVIYSVTQTAGADYYVWTIPSGASIVSGDSTNSIVVEYGTGNSQGLVTVYGVNRFGAGEAESFNGQINPPNHIHLSGSPNLCGTDSITLTAAASGSALLFTNSGQQWVQIPFNSPETDYTFEMSFKTTHSYTALSSVHASDLGGDHDRNLYLEDGNIYHRLYSDETINSTGLNLADDEWHHVAIVVESGVGQFIYIDGVEVASGTKGESDFNWDNTIDIGYNGNTFNGSIDNVRLWNVVLSPGQIQQNMHTDITTNLPGLIGNWRFDEGSGTGTANAVNNDMAILHNTSWIEKNSNSYLWSTGATTQAITVSSAGTYSVSISNSQGCSDSSNDIIVTENPLPSVSVSSLNDVGECQIAFNLNIGSPVGGTYSGTGVTNNQFNPAVGADTYTIVYTYTDGVGCSNSDSTSITVDALPSVSMSTMSQVGECHSSFTLTSGAPSGGYYSGLGVNAGIFDPATAGSGTHNLSYTIQDNHGCENVAFGDIVVTQTPEINSSASTTICDAGSTSITAGSTNGTITWYTSPTGGSSIASGSTYTTPTISTTSTYYVEATENGCTSARIPVMVTVSNSHSTYQSLSLCAGESVTVGTSVYTISGTYTDHLSTQEGCDSIVTTILTVNSSIDNSTTLQGPSITANATAATYQWINCSNGNAIIPAATSQTYSPSSNGDYAVIVTQNSCSDTSACVNFIVTGLQAHTMENNISVYPNPSQGVFTIKSATDLEYTIVNNIGQVVINGNLSKLNNFTLDIKDLSRGVYYVIGKNDKESTKQKIVVM
ncbi:MAG: T9SS type A sorting domain-containing protein [Bacteroidetes bacterium]|nr:MAG: T9SS type A sorting domain-containing protein [Bacteroidota bacterium]